MQDCDKLSVILPAYNEERTIYSNVLETAKTVATFAPNFEIIIVNDGSADQTVSEARRAALKEGRIRVIDNEVNKGKGFALKTGTKAATGDYIAFCDADLEIHPYQLEGFMKILLETPCDAVIGSKLQKGSKIEYPWHRKIISWGYYLVLLLLFRLNVKDTQTGLKLFRAEAIKPVMERILVKRFAYDIEVLAILQHRGKSIESVPVEVVFRRGIYGSRIKMRDISNVTIDTMAIFYRMHLLKYYDKDHSTDP